MPRHDIIVIGASAGGVEALRELVRNLPSDLPAAVFIVLHIPAQATSVLPDILNRAGPLPAAHAVDYQAIEYGRIYVAPPDKHLLVKQGYVRVVRGPKENRARPAIDPLFRTAARAYGPRVAGVVLTGGLDDGTAGAMAVKERGGIVIVQDPSNAFASGMPSSAMTYVNVDHCLPLSNIAPLLVRLAHEGAEGESIVSSKMEKESKAAELDMATMENEEKVGTPSVFACPECSGVLWELHEGELMRFRCRVGHAYSADGLLAEQSDALERALWVALRALEERISLTRRLATRARQSNQDLVAEHFEKRTAETEDHAALIRQLLMNSKKSAEPEN